jgi:6-hydroxy-3-succinoylpyridine 3-monooxygenase
MGRRCNIYIDGFNFYYGAMRGTRHKWLGLHVHQPHDQPALTHSSFVGM